MKIKILVVKPGEEPEVQEIDATLTEMQAVVGGYLELVQPFEDGVDIWLNEEGKLQGLPPHPDRFDPMVPYGDYLVGTYFLARHDNDGETTSLTKADIQRYSRMFRLLRRRRRRR